MAQPQFRLRCYAWLFSSLVVCDTPTSLLLVRCLCRGRCCCLSADVSNGHSNSNAQPIPFLNLLVIKVAPGEDVGGVTRQVVQQLAEDEAARSRHPQGGTSQPIASDAGGGSKKTEMVPVVTNERPPVMVFAILRNGHEGLRGLLKTLAEHAEAFAAEPSVAGAAAVANAWKEFNMMLSYHMRMEDEYFFGLLDSMFDGRAAKEGFRDEHVEDHKLLQATGAVIEAAGSAPSAATAKAALDAIVSYQAHHEEHLVHEENVMMPLTAKVDPPQIRPGMLHKYLMLDFDATLAAIPLNVREMARRNPYASFVMLVWAVQRVLTPEQYARLLPGIREAAGEKWGQLEQDGCGEPGKFKQADADALVASGIVVGGSA
jgi:hemerythrin-like domain-containing protein